ncbi:hypothetical protein FU659_23085 [Paenibacillus sp. N3.4]|nr:hypothetical protein FU659_23085 [Paenibacillus sp. N3.4]
MKVFLSITQTIYLISLPFWFLVWGLSFMAFDNGISLWGIICVVVISLYPVAVIVCSILSWIFKSKNKSRLAVILCLIPSLWIFSGILLVLIY